MTPPAADTVWYLSRDGQQFGPFGDAEFRQMHRDNRVEPNDYLWSPDLGDWKFASDVLPPPPPRPVAPPPMPARPAAPATWQRPDTELATVGYHGQHHVEPQGYQREFESSEGSFKFATVVYMILGLILPFWPITLPLFWYLAYKSYKKVPQIASRETLPDLNERGRAGGSKTLVHAPNTRG